MYLSNYVRIYEFVHRVSKKRDLRCFKGFFCHISSKIFMNFYEILENSGMKLYFFRKQTLFFYWLFYTYFWIIYCHSSMFLDLKSEANKIKNLLHKTSLITDFFSHPVFMIMYLFLNFGIPASFYLSTKPWIISALITG